MKIKIGNSSGGIGVTGALAIVFITLKLTHNIDWGWIWVLSPMWIPLALFLAIVAGIVLFGFFKFLLTGE